jgi:hypothetical protein
MMEVLASEMRRFGQQHMLGKARRWRNGNCRLEIDGNNNHMGVPSFISSGAPFPLQRLS